MRALRTPEIAFDIEELRAEVGGRAREAQVVVGGLGRVRLFRLRGQVPASGKPPPHGSPRHEHESERPDYEPKEHALTPSEIAGQLARGAR
jgi:hypothetical protein